MNSLLLIALAAPVLSCEPGSVCSSESGAGARAEATITLSLTVEPAHMVSIEQEHLGAEAYKVTAVALLTGPDCATSEEQLLVFDDRVIQDGPMITFQAVDGLLRHETPFLVTAVAWPGDGQVSAYLAGGP